VVVGLAIALAELLLKPGLPRGRADAATRAFPMPGDGIPFACDRQAAEKVGRRYLAIAPSEANVGSLLEHLGLAASPSDDGDEHRTHTRFAERRRREFANGDTVVIDGWILARSEARLCALIALGATAKA
jgi:hypothetical protein